MIIADINFGGQAVQNLAILITFVGGVIVYSRARIPKQAFTNLEKLVSTYKKTVDTLEEQAKIDAQQHIENVKAIADLQGQIKVYKDLPLEKMAGAMQDINKTNQQILDILTKSAITLVHDTEAAKIAADKVATTLNSTDSPTAPKTVVVNT